MEMQEMKERKAHAKQVQADEEHSEEVDPSVQTAPLLSEQDPRGRTKHAPSWLRYILDRVWSAIFFSIACFGLYEAQFVHEVLYAPEAHRGSVNLGIFFSTLVVLFGSYIELYRSMVLGEKVSYDTAKTSTHAMLFSMCAAALWYVLQQRSLQLDGLSVWTLTVPFAAFRLDCGRFGTG